MNLLHLVNNSEINKAVPDSLGSLLKNSIVKSRKECPQKFSPADLKSRLTPLQFEVTQLKGTEKQFCSYHIKQKGHGIYYCVVCLTELFHSDKKFESKSGWPAFFEPIEDIRLAYFKDMTYGMVRVEVACANCGSHLGHVFNDGPKPSGLRYCVNSVSLEFKLLDEPNTEIVSDKFYIKQLSSSNNGANDVNLLNGASSLKPNAKSPPPIAQSKINTFNNKDVTLASSPAKKSSSDICESEIQLDKTDNSLLTNSCKISTSTESSSFELPQNMNNNSLDKSYTKPSTAATLRMQFFASNFDVGNGYSPSNEPKFTKGRSTSPVVRDKPMSLSSDVKYPTFPLNCKNQKKPIRVTNI